MNRLVVLLFAFGFAASANGQGSVLFANQVGTTVNAPVFIYGTSAGPGPDYSAQLYLYGPDNSLTPIIPITTFSGSGPSSTEDRYWIPQTVDVSVQPGTDATR